MGLTVTFLGLGEKGFKTMELKLIGPSLVGCGMFFTVLRILFCTVPAFFRSCFACCRKKDDTEELLEVDEDEKRKLEMTMRTAMRRNGLLKPMRDTVTASHNERRNTIRQGEGPQPLVISDDDEDDRRSRPLPRPQIRPARQGVSMRRHDEEDFSDSSSSTFSLADLEDLGPVPIPRPGPELIPRPPHLGGSTKDIRLGEIIMNTNKL